MNSVKRRVVFILVIPILELLSCHSGPENKEEVEIPLIPPAENIANYRSVFEKELSGWALTFTGFDLQKLKLLGTMPFEDLAGSDIDSLNVFYSIYKPVLSFSPDSSRFIDIYSYLLALSKEGNQVVSYGGDIDQSIELCEPKAKDWRRILFFGPSTTIQEVSWMNDSTFVLAGGTENTNVQSVSDNEDLQFNPVVYIGHIKTRTFYIFESSDTACIQRTPYDSPKLKRLHIIQK